MLMKRVIPKPAWTEEEKRILVEYAASTTAKVQRPLTLTDFKSLRLPNRTFAAVRSQAIRLGLYEPTRKTRRWTAREQQVLVVLARQRGLGARSIRTKGFFASAMKTWSARSVNSIAQKKRRMRLVDPEKSRRARYAKRLTDEQKAQLRQELRDNPHAKTTEEFARDYGVAPSTIRRFRQRWGIEHSWRVAMQMPGSVAKRQKLAELTRSRSLEMWRRRKDSLQKRLLKRKQRMLERAADGDELSLRTCARCGREWPATKVFFAPSPKRRNGKRVATYLRRSCRVCPRHQN